MPHSQRAILFRFHTKMEVCRNHIAILRKYNPDVPIYGMYGGPAKEWQEAQSLPLDHCWAIPLDDPRWKWQNGDLALRWWFREVGHQFAFDLLNVMEWDLIILEPLDQFFAGITDGVTLAELAPLSQIIDTWTWTSGQQGRKEWTRLLTEAQKQFDYKDEPQACLFGGVMVSRIFLEKYTAIPDVPSLCNDEVRTPLFAQILGIPLYRSSFTDDYFTAGNEKIITPESLYQVIATTNQRSFHPVKEALDLDKLPL